MQPLSGSRKLNHAVVTIPFIPTPAMEFAHIRASAERKLRERMGELSEERYFAGWMDGLEYLLWAEDILELQRLAVTAQGWWIWPDKEHEEEFGGEIFVPLPLWEQMYREYREYSFHCFRCQHVSKVP